MSYLKHFKFYLLGVLSLSLASCTTLSSFQLNQSDAQWQFLEIRSAESPELFTELRGALAYREWYVREMDHCRIKLSLDPQHADLAYTYSFHLNLPDTPMSLKARKSDCTEGPCYAPGQWIWDIGTRKHLAGHTGDLIVSIRNSSTGQEIGEALLHLKPWQEEGAYDVATQPLQAGFFASFGLVAFLMLLIGRLFRY